MFTSWPASGCSILSELFITNCNLISVQGPTCLQFTYTQVSFCDTSLREKDIWPFALKDASFGLQVLLQEPCICISDTSLYRAEKFPSISWFPSHLPYECFGLTCSIVMTCTYCILSKSLSLVGSQSPYLFSVVSEMSLSVADVCPVARDIILEAPVPHSLALAEFVEFTQSFRPAKFLFPVSEMPLV